MKRHFNYYVKKEIIHGKVPHAFCRSLFPHDRDIRNQMYKAKLELKFSKVDQENVELQIEEWRKSLHDDAFFFRGYGEREKSENGDIDEYKSGSLPNSRLLFVHQTKNQKSLLKKYGNHICLLDATYKTTRYAVPLFFVVVKTNIDYQVVASFVVQDETTESITEALSMLADWNPSWNPMVFMVDKSDQEINAIGNVFERARVLLCDFHREQSWGRWLRKGENGLDKHKDRILCFLRDIKKSRTDEVCKLNIDKLMSTDFWTMCKHFRSWFQPWIEIKDKWVDAYRHDLMEIVVNTNNGIETKNRDFKRNFLCKYKDTSLSGMIKVLVEQFCPVHYNRYYTNNFMQSDLYRSYNLKFVRPYMQNKPLRVINHMSKRLGRAIVEIAKENIIEALPSKEDEKEYYVMGRTGVYIVSLGNVLRYPSCTCDDWFHYKLPCKHMLAIIELVDNISWECFSYKYRSSQFLNLDREIVPVADVGPMQSVNLEDAGFTAVDDRKEDKFFPIKNDDEKSKAHLSQGQGQCRDILKELTDMTYLISDHKVMNDLLETLTEARDKFKEILPSENGITLERNASEKRCSKAYSRLPKPKRKISSRVGEAAERSKQAAEINIPIKKRKVASIGGEVKYTLYNEHGIQMKSCVDISAKKNFSSKSNFKKSKFVLPSDKSHRRSKGIKSFFNKKKFVELTENNDLLSIQAEVSKTLSSVVNQVEISDFESKDQGLGDLNHIEKNVNKCKTEKKSGLKNLNFDTEESVRLTSGSKLSDISINLAHNILSLQFEEFSGLQNSLKGIRNRFKVINPGSKYVQILHDKENDHWVCIGNITENRNDNSEHYVYDTALNKVSVGIVKQVANYSKHPGKELVLRMEKVQKQHNGTDCGVYAIAIATCLAFGIDPKYYQFEPNSMRDHLKLCFINLKMSVFPGKHINAIRTRKLIGEERVPLFCLCRLPYCEKDPKMVQCDGPNGSGCKEWFHKNCAQVDPVYFTKKGASMIYLCPSCREEK